MAILPLTKPLQLTIVFIIISNLTILTGLVSFRSPANFGWMFGVPILLAIVSNTNAGSRGLMSGALVMCSLLTMMLTAEVFGLGP